MTRTKTIDILLNVGRRHSMANKDILFSPLGGGQEVGANCYLLKLGNDNLLLDCGIGNNRYMKYAPDLYTPLKQGLLQSLQQISKIFISHAHLDHVGFLGEILKENNTSAVYMTEVTKILTGIQLKNCSLFKHKRNKQLNLYNSLLETRCTPVSFYQEIPFKDYSVTFLPAGHIPGAMMLLIRYAGRNILYTGDYSVNSTAFTSGCQLPNEKIDILITCGLHARRSTHVKNSNLNRRFMHLSYYLDNGISVACNVHQLSKGIELLKLLNKYYHNEVPIYVDESAMQVIKLLENKGIPIMEKNNYLLKNGIEKYPCITLSNKQHYFGGRFHSEDIDFSLHDDFNETVDFIKKINPAQAVIIHSPPEKNYDDISIEQVIMRDADCRTQFIFPENGEIIVL